MLSGKVSSAQDHRESLLEVIKNDNWVPFSKVHYAFDKENMEMTKGYWGYHDKLELNDRTSLESFLKKIPENLRMYPIIPKTLLPLYIMLFFLLGLLTAIYKIIKRKSVMDAILLMFIPYSLIIEALAYPFPRHHLFLVPFFCIYTIEGIALISSALARKRSVIKRNILILLFSVIVLFIGNEYINKLSNNQLKETGFREYLSADISVSQYLKKRKAKTIMSIHPSFAVRTISDWQVLPQAPLFEIIKFAKHKEVDYVILPDPDGSQNFYFIADMKRSYIPEDSDDEFGYTIIEHSKYFDLINFVKNK
jgi:hypothetical protein